MWPFSQVWTDDLGSGYRNRPSKLPDSSASDLHCLRYPSSVNSQRDVQSARLFYVSGVTRKDLVIIQNVLNGRDTSKLGEETTLSMAWPSLTCAQTMTYQYVVVVKEHL